MNVFKKIKDIFKKPTPRKQTISFKTSKLDFIGKTKTVEVISEQDVDDKINDNNQIINADFEQKLTELKDYSDKQDNTVKQEVQQNINDLKQYSDNEDKKVRQYSDSEDAKIKQSVTNVSNKLNQVERTANNANTVATRADNQSKTNKGDISTLKSLGRSNNYQWYTKKEVQGNIWSKQDLAGGISYYELMQAQSIAIPGAYLNTVYGWLSSRFEKENNQDINGIIECRVYFYVLKGQGYFFAYKPVFDADHLKRITIKPSNNQDLNIRITPGSSRHLAFEDWSNNTKTEMFLMFNIMR